MAKYIHVVLNTPDPESKLAGYATTVLTKLTGNTHYPNPVPTLAIFGAHIAALIKADSDVAAGVPDAVSVRNAAREAVKEDLEHERDYVQGTMESQAGVVDLTAIQAFVESAGMSLKKVTPRPKAVLGIKAGDDEGSLVCTAPYSPARDTNEWGYSLDQKTYVDLPSSRQSTMTATGLPVGVPLYVRHRTLTKDGYTTWSAPMLITLK
jgi:hypothetical protein